MALLGAICALAVALVTVAEAHAADPLRGGRTLVDLTKLPDGMGASAFHRSKEVRKNEFRFDVCEGTFDPITGDGYENFCRQGIGFRFKGDRAKTGSYEMSFSSHGKLRARVVGNEVALARVRGGDLTRSGFGAKLTDAALKLTEKGATALNKALGARREAPFEPGRIGFVTTTTEPASVQIESGTATLALDAVTATKLDQKGVDPTGGGVSAGEPASMSGDGRITFPLTGGRVPLYPNAFGVVTAAGAVKLEKTDPVGPACDAEHPVGTTFELANPRSAFEYNAFMQVDATASGVTTPFFSAARLPRPPQQIATDPATRKVVIVVDPRSTMDMAEALNLVFGNSSEGCGSQASNFAIDDALGTLRFDATAR